MNYIISQIKFVTKFQEKRLNERKIPEYPLDALRELLLNAIPQRLFKSGRRSDKIFDNYITFYNLGKLANHLTIEDLKSDKYSAYKGNKMIARSILFNLEILRNIGSGFYTYLRNAIADYRQMKIG